MASSTLIPVSEYLSTTYEPDCDYIDGELQERNVGEFSHGVLQALIASRLQRQQSRLERNSRAQSYAYK